MNHERLRLATARLEFERRAATSLYMSALIPSLYVSHGSPMIALGGANDPTGARASWKAFADRIPRPRGIVVASAHHERDRTTVASAADYRTIHDFRGFPAPLYALSYAAHGDAELAARCAALLGAAGFTVDEESSPGLDHGAWVPLLAMFPAGDVPVVQIAIESQRDPAHHLALGRALSTLREEGVLVLGSGSLTHNLAERQNEGAAPTPHVAAFQKWVWERLAANDIAALVDYRHAAPYAARVHPTDEHWLPFYVALGAAGEAPFTAEQAAGEVAFGALAMDAIVFESA